MPFSTSTAADVETLLGPDERWFWEKLLGRVVKGGGKLVGVQRVGGSRYWAVLAKAEDGSDKVLFLDAMDPASKKLLDDLQARLRGETYYGRYWDVEPDRDFAKRVAENLGPGGVSIVLLSSALVGDDETFKTGLKQGATEIAIGGGLSAGGMVGGKILDILAGAAKAKRIASLRKLIPSVRNGEFDRWFNGLTPEEFEEIWKYKELREVIESRLRHPGGLHEWHLVSRTPAFKRWGLSAEQIKEMRSVIEDTHFVNPPGSHGGRGSTKAHNELLEIIDTSLDYDTFVRRLRNWASYRLKGGAAALPLGLRP